MSNPGIEMGMTPPQPGTVIRIGAIGEFGLSICGGGADSRCAPRHTRTW